MTPTPHEIEMERAEVSAKSITAMDDAAEFGVYFNRVDGEDLRACAGQLPGFKLEPSHDQANPH